MTGPVIALLLREAGFDVTVYEAAPAAAPLGGGLIGLDHWSLDILERLGTTQPELVAYPSERIVYTTVTDRAPTHAVARIYPGRNTTWTLLHHALTRRLPGGVIRASHRLTGLSGAHGRPVLRFADGRQATADLVVFADGRASTGRRILDPDRQLHYGGYIAHRGTASPAAALADFVRMEPCKGAQFNIAPVPDGLDWTFYLNATDSQYRDWFGATPGRRPFAYPHHVSGHARAAVDGLAEALLPAVHAAVVRDTATRMAVPVMDIDPPARMVWPIGTGHAVLVGDALAPVRPHTAAGANNGIDQAAGLAAALGQHVQHGADLDAALRGWQRRHLPAALAAIERGPAIAARLGLGTAARHPSEALDG